jgi:5-methylcytosine-specific restriction endonuclease McrBC GTP-binding regulatory subunit McrB
MNTADKSIALVDVALRRRFEFDELRPNFSVCNGLDSTMMEVLERLNQRITLRKDRDHRIGHAYFMKVNDEASFNRTFRQQIIPLLQEYFYSDWDGLRYVLADEGSFIHSLGAEVRDARTKWQWYFDTGHDALNCFTTLRTNYGFA